MPKVIIYSTPTCHFCEMAKAFFEENNVSYEEFNVAADPAKRSELIEKSGQMGVPVILIGDQLVLGYDEPKLRSLLGL